jgi:hypothetical protein
VARRRTAGAKAFFSEFDSMNAVFQHASRHVLISTNPASRIERPTPRPLRIQMPG